jgi:transglutaminase-like putative cysteine protease
MNQRRHLTLVAAGASLLGALPLSTVFDRWTWLVDAVLAVGVTLGTALLVRTLRVPAWTSTLAMAGAFIVLLGWIFPSGHEWAGVIPTVDTFRNFDALLVAAGRDMRELGIPVEDRDGLLFLSTLGVGAVAIAVDMFAVVLRRPALAGLPMLAIYSVPVAVHDDSVNIVPFIAGAGGFLWLLVTDNVERVRRFGRRFTGDGRDVDLWEPSPLAAAGRRLAVVGVLLAIVLPVAVPGMTSGLLDKFGGVGDGTGRPGTGRAGQSVNLFTVLQGNLVQDKQYDMVRVSTNDPSPYYLRFGVAAELTPTGFRNGGTAGGVPLGNLPPPPQPDVPGVFAHSYHATVDILGFEMPVLPVYLYPTKIERLDNAWLYERNTQVLYSSRAGSKGKKFGFDYVRVDYSAEALRSARPLPQTDPIQRTLTYTPEKVEVVSKRVTEVIRGKNSQYDRVRAIFDSFSQKEGFTYSLSTKPGTSGKDIVDFLTNKQGYCEQYASAMAWMVRVAGYPARVAFGFTRGVKRSGNQYTLTNLNLHAWTEVYFDRFGWVPFDPTPGSSVPGSVSSAWAPDPNGQNARGSGEGGPDELDPSSGADPSGAAAAKDPFQDESTATGGGSTSDSTGPRWPLWVLLAAVTIGALLLAPAVFRILLRRRRWPDRIAVPAAATGPPLEPGQARVIPSEDPVATAARRRAHNAWNELLDTMVDFRIDVDEAETPRVTARRLISVAHLTSSAETGARSIGTAEERARYARTPMESESLAESLREVRAAIAGRVSRRTRVFAALFPRSVLQRWRADAIAATANLVNGTGRRRDALIRAVSPRRMLPSRLAR